MSRALIHALTEFDKRDTAAGSTVKQYLKTLLRSSFMDLLDQVALTPSPSIPYPYNNTSSHRRQLSLPRVPSSRTSAGAPSLRSPKP